MYYVYSGERNLIKQHIIIFSIISLGRHIF